MCKSVSAKRTRQRKRWTGRRGSSYRFCIRACLLVRMCLSLWMTLHFNGFSLFALCVRFIVTHCVWARTRSLFARVWVYAYLLRHMFHQKCVLHTIAVVLSVKFYYLPPISMFPIPSNRIPSILCVRIFYTSDWSHSHFSLNRIYLIPPLPFPHRRCFLIFYFTVKMTIKYLPLSALTHHTDVRIHTSTLRMKQ